jgi:hypothetical protein
MSTVRGIFSWNLWRCIHLSKVHHSVGVDSNPNRVGISLIDEVESNEDGTQTCCKVRGITLNHRNQLLINFDTIHRMIRSNNDEVVKVVDQATIARDKNNTKLLTTSTTKDYKLVFDKRRRLNTFLSVPFGYWFLAVVFRMKSKLPISSTSKLTHLTLYWNSSLNSGRFSSRNFEIR